MNAQMGEKVPVNTSTSGNVFNSVSTQGNVQIRTCGRLSSAAAAIIKLHLPFSHSEVGKGSQLIKGMLILVKGH